MFLDQADRLPPAQQNLRNLIWLRNIEIGGQLLGIGVATLLMGVALPATKMMLVVAALALVNLFAWWRLRQQWPVTDGELFGHLLVDVAALALLLYLSGGSTNPFVSLFLLPLTIAAAILPARYTWSMALLTTVSYALLLFFYMPLEIAPSVVPIEPMAGMESMAGMDHSHHMAVTASDNGMGDMAWLHVLGMWFNFLVSALLIALFVGRMADALRERDRRLAAAREEVLRNERIIALGTLAAGAAHELGTPLSTMAVVVRELQHAQGEQGEYAADLAVLRHQIDSCKTILSKLLAAAGQQRLEQVAAQPVDSYLKELLAKWQLLRPSIFLTVKWRSEPPAPPLAVDETLGQALINLINNAADASPQGIEVEVAWHSNELTLTINDHGPGLSPEALANIGKPFFTTKGPGHGIGIGLFLANATIERFGGSVKLFNREGGGACTQVVLPLGGGTNEKH